MRMPWPAAVGGVAVALLGATALVRGAVPQTGAGASPAVPIVVSNAYVRPPVLSGDPAAAYFTVRNNGDRSDRLVSVISGAGAEAVLHTAGMTVTSTEPVIPAHGTLVLSTGRGHVMIEKLYGPLTAGQTTNLTLTFDRAGEVSVAAKVIAVGASAPTGG